MNVLGILWAIGSTAALFRGNRITDAVGEERFTRIKNDDSFPMQAIQSILESSGLKNSELDAIAIPSLKQDLLDIVKRPAKWSIDDYIYQQKAYWKPRIYEGRQGSEAEIWKDRLDYQVIPRPNYANNENLEQKRTDFAEDRRHIVAECLDVDLEKVHLVEHHLGHAYYAYYASPFRKEKVLTLTIDAYGDGLNATIGVFNENGEYKRVFETANCHIARIYRYTTLLLGMKPNEHEFKVMGLAPYAKPAIARKALEVYKSTLQVKGLDFEWKVEPKDSYFWFKEQLEGCRFDGIASALQEWTEDLLVDWVRNAIKEFGVSTVVMSGGVAMNVKANGKIAALPELKKMFVAGTGTDESLALGSSMVVAEKLTKAKGRPWDAEKVPFLESLYLGPEADRASEEWTVAGVNRDEIEVIKKFDDEYIAELLATGLVFARSVGRMEFGQRSLCNRAIIADPIVPGVVGKINSAIKNRDFWMPFAPVVLDSFADRYLENPKAIQSPHMSVGFPSTPEGWEAMPAGCHPADRSARAQILTESANPGMHRLLSAFAKRTGRGALLNTSFNLHGYPIVNTSDEALYVFLESGLDALLLNHFLLVKKASLKDGSN